MPLTHALRTSLRRNADLSAQSEQDHLAVLKLFTQHADATDCCGTGCRQRRYSACANWAMACANLATRALLESSPFAAPCASG